MNKIQRFLAAAFIAVFGLSASAVTLIPVPIDEEAPLRLGGAGKLSNSFNPVYLTHLSGILGVAYGFGGGFEGGFQFRGGANSPQLFKAGNTANADLGGDLMLRYLGSVTDLFYIGLQGRVGYDYAFNRANITEASTVTAGVGIPFGLMFGEAAAVYIMPELEFGNRDTSKTEGVFGSLVGIGGAVGGHVSVGGPKIFLEVKPKAVNLGDASNTFGMDTVLGVAFDL